MNISNYLCIRQCLAETANEKTQRDFQCEIGFFCFFFIFRNVLKRDIVETPKLIWTYVSKYSFMPNDFSKI